MNKKFTVIYFPQLPSLSFFMAWMCKGARDQRRGPVRHGGCQFPTYFCRRNDIKEITKDEKEILKLYVSYVIPCRISFSFLLILLSNNS